MGKKQLEMDSPAFSVLFSSTRGQKGSSKATGPGSQRHAQPGGEALQGAKKPRGQARATALRVLLPLPAQMPAPQAGAAAKTPPAAVCGPGRVTVVSWAVRGASRVRAAARRWRGPTAESRQAAARRGGLSSPSGREIKGWRVGGGQ